MEMGNKNVEYNDMDKWGGQYNANDSNAIFCMG